MQPRLARSLVLGSLASVLVLSGAFVAVTYRPTPPPTGVTVLATFYPMYDFARHVAGDRANVSLLVPMTVDVHAFEPTPSSVEAVATASLLIANGLGVEPWLSGVVNAAENPHLVVVEASAGIPTLPVPAPFQVGNATVDPHVWLDPVLAKEEVQNILGGLIAVDPTDAAYFSANAAAYDAQLDLLDHQAENLTRSPATHEFVTFHESFAYFAARYHLTQVPIAGPFQEDPTPSDIQNVVDAVQGGQLCYVGYESLTSPAIAEAIASETHATLILMDPIEGLSASDQASGQDYVTKMQADLSSFALAVNDVGCA